MAGEKRHFVVVKEELYAFVKEYSKENRAPVQDVVRMALEEFMERSQQVA